MSAHPPEPVFSVRWGAATDMGVRRVVNEDSHLAAPPLFAVADGMGGHARGEEASRRVVDELAAVAGRPWLDPEELYRAVSRAGEAVRLLADGPAAPGSTLAGVAVTHQYGLPCWLVFNIGDSRVYRRRDDVLEQISVDHSRAQELRDAGDERAAAATAQNVITRALGGGGAVSPLADQWLLPAATGDRMLVCSDGVSSELTDQFIAATLGAAADPQDAARLLVEAAVGAGGRDNATAVVVDAVAVEPAPGVEVLPFGADTLVGADAGDDDTIPDAVISGRLAEAAGLTDDAGSDDE